MSEIPKLNQEIMEACQLYVDNLIKPIHSLGKLEDMAVRMAGILGEVKPTYLNKAVVIFGGDTAVDGENKTKGQLSHAEMKLVAQGAGILRLAEQTDHRARAAQRAAQGSNAIAGRAIGEHSAV